MNLSASITAQIRHKVAAIKSSKRVIGIKTSGNWQGENVERIGVRSYRFAQCDSTLAVREVLSTSASDSDSLVIVTDIDESILGADTLARFAGSTLHTLNPWRILEDLFRARATDPQLLNKRWLAELLLQDVPPEGFVPVTNGLLDAETVWGIILRRKLGLRAARPDARDLLFWTLDDDLSNHFVAATLEFQDALTEWIAQSAGHAGELILETVRAGHGRIAICIGLACEVVFSDAAPPEAREAAVRLERFTGGSAVTLDVGLRWFETTSEVLEIIRRGDQSTDQRTVRDILVQFDTLLKELRAQSLAYLSRYSPAGFELRLQLLAESLHELLISLAKDFSAPRLANIDELLMRAQNVFAHASARDERPRVEGVMMAVRLARWMTETSDTEARDLPTAAVSYARNSSFVDWARYRFHVGEPNELLARTYKLLFDHASERREKENQSFAHLFAEWTEASRYDLGGENLEARNGGKIMRVEEVLEAALAPLAEHSAVLLIVVDGMSWAVFNELAESITRVGWIEWGTEDDFLPCPVVAALPSVTEASRSSLLRGTLASGVSKDEVVGFRSHPLLMKLSRSKYPPLLFHKGGLTSPGASDLSLEVREAILHSEQRIVGVVVNGIDDHLAKGEQIVVTWTLDHVPVLRALLEQAALSDRLVIMASDHGHIIERGTIFRQNEPGERYRRVDNLLQADELIISGSRVLLPPGERRLIAPWSESVRYSANKKHGYHGGVTPQECLVPLAVFAKREHTIAGWKELPSRRPSWWGMTREIPNGRKRRRAYQSSAEADMRRQSLKVDEMPLFTKAESYRGHSGGLNHDWITMLVASPIFHEQEKVLGRTAPPRELVSRFLSALDDAGGQLTIESLAQRLELPEIRLNEVILLVRRLLNVEGYDAITVDEAAGIVSLNSELMRREFEIEV